MSDRRTRVTSAPSKCSSLSCRWALVPQRSGKKRPIFYSPQRWLCGRWAGWDLVSFWLPAPFAALLLCPQKKQLSLTSSVCTNSIFSSIIHVSFALSELVMIFPYFISPHPPSNTHFSPRLTSQKAYLPARASTCLPAAPTDHLCRTTTSHCVRQLSNVLSSW